MICKKRGQAAMEFLMTYGWAILVVLVVIGALAYFGVLNPESLLPEKCTLPIGLYCEDHNVRSDTGTITLRIQNGMGRGIVITGVEVTGVAITQECVILDGDLSEPGGYGHDVPGFVLPNGASGILTLDCPSISQPRGNTKFNFRMTYCSDQYHIQDECIAFSHQMTGELMARVYDS